MARLFVVEDQMHAEQAGEFLSIADAWAELRRLSSIPWDKPPNIAACKDWQKCGRDYEIVEYETDKLPWEELARHAGLKMDVRGLEWGPGAPKLDT